MEESRSRRRRRRGGKSVSSSCVGVCDADIPRQDQASAEAASLDQAPPPPARMEQKGNERDQMSTTREKPAKLTEYIIGLMIIIVKDVVLVGEKGGNTYYIVTEEGKKIIRSLLNTLSEIHQQGKCPKKFNESNIVMEKGNVKFSDIEFEEITNEGIRNNYRNVRSIIRKTLFGDCSNDEIPEDIKHLLRLMARRSSFRMGYVISSHASLISLGNRCHFFKVMYDHIKNVLCHSNKQAQKKILDALPYKGDWHTTLKSNALLEESFYSRETPYDPNGKSIVFLTFYRNTVAHKMEKYLQPLQHSENIVLEYTREQFEEILAAVFPLYLPTMQEQLAKHGELEKLNLKYVF
uniref:Uncharacterized protein n=1 Tax=Oryza meridionalis TaxID=40149 RepID=A0A0E0CJJ4_9ORYZ